MFGQETDSGWAYPGDSAATIAEGWSPPPLVEGGEWLPLEEEIENGEPSPYGPGYWIDIMGRAIQPAPPPQPVVIQEEPTPWWIWGLGIAGIVWAVKSL